jgi:hypothetical protein
MSTSAAKILSEIGMFLHDPGDGAVWPPTVRLAFLNEAIRTVGLLRPDSMATTETVALTADTPLQSIPADGTRLLYVVRNIVTGRPIRKIHRETINDIADGWEPAAITEVNHYMFDEENPTFFYVYPVPSASLDIEIVYSKTPATVTADSVALGLPDIFISPLKDFVYSRCFGMETKGADAGKATYYMQQFYNALGVKLQNEGVLKALQDDPVGRA